MALNCVQSTWARSSLWRNATLRAHRRWFNLGGGDAMNLDVSHPRPLAHVDCLLTALGRSLDGTHRIQCSVDDIILSEHLEQRSDDRVDVEVFSVYHDKHRGAIESIRGGETK